MSEYRINIRKLIETGDCKPPEENSQSRIKLHLSSESESSGVSPDTVKKGLYRRHIDRQKNYVQNVSRPTLLSSNIFRLSENIRTIVRIFDQMIISGFCKALLKFLLLFAALLRRNLSFLRGEFFEQKKKRSA